jgi:hypothetical protein
MIETDAIVEMLETSSSTQQPGTAARKSSAFASLALSEAFVLTIMGRAISDELQFHVRLNSRN